MKKILITGANSYVGSSFKEWLSKNPEKYKVDTVSLRDDKWKEVSFAGYDTVLHTVGIAHVDAKPEMEAMYYEINRDLTIQAGQKSRDDQVKQFIFLSSIIVYGNSSKTNNQGVIDENTVPVPANFYGNSKLQAEEGIKSLESDDFKVAIIRPPMIYGKGSKGNYPKLAAAARLSPVFPAYNNQRSMLHIDNLSEFLKKIIDNNDSGLFFPQNSEYVRTSDLVKEISKVHNKRIVLIKIFNPFIRFLTNRVNLINKVFGNLIYSQSLSEYKEDYQVRDLSESIKVTEK